MSLSDNLRKLRNSLNLTQDQVSTELKINRATYAHYETGRREPDIETLKLLAKYYNVTTDYLLETDITKPTILSMKEFNENIQNQYSPLNKLVEEIDKLSPESQKDLEAYIELLKLRDIQKKDAEVADESINIE
ncbi:helix-turn-helix domain-containing protein [Tissierella sp. P1]|uniref:helix-turn-helix domain-containing protein n=1 Tax=Tissierella sp. P1 TaxID=1280483 RepID=UPI00191212DA|nr:helix-turn-helix transcriptional regulator [Tissierella sp. P1]